MLRCVLLRYNFGAEADRTAGREHQSERNRQECFTGLISIQMCGDSFALCGPYGLGNKLRPHLDKCFAAFAGGQIGGLVNGQTLDDRGDPDQADHLDEPIGQPIDKVAYGRVVSHRWLVHSLSHLAYPFIFYQRQKAELQLGSAVVGGDSRPIRTRSHDLPGVFRLTRRRG